MRARAVLTAAVVLAVAGAAHADDDKPEFQHMRIAESGDNLTVSTEPVGRLGKLFDAAAFEALRTAPVTTVLIRIQITPPSSNTPIAEQVITREAAYDRWDDVYFLRTDQPGARKDSKAKSHAEALKWLVEVDRIPVAKLAAVPIGPIFVLKMVVTLNPVSPEVLAEVRRRLSQGNGGGLDRGGASFGSFVSLFYNPKIADADRQLRVQSQEFYRLPP